MPAGEIKVTVDTTEVKLALLDAELELATARVAAAIAARDTLKASRDALALEQAGAGLAGYGA